MSFESMLSFNAIYKIDMFSVIEVVAVILSMYTFHVVHVDTWSTISALLHDPTHLLQMYHRTLSPVWCISVHTFNQLVSKAGDDVASMCAVW